MELLIQEITPTPSSHALTTAATATTAYGRAVG